MVNRDTYFLLCFAYHWMFDKNKQIKKQGDFPGKYKKDSNGKIG